MALIKCSECGKQVSDKAAACPNCANPIGGSGSVGNNAFEKRIEQYKANDYKLLKRSGDSVQMLANKGNVKVSAAFLIICGVLLNMLFITSFIIAMPNVVMTRVAFLVGGFVFVFLGVWINQHSRTAIITLTKTGKLEETGNVLKDK